MNTFNAFLSLVEIFYLRYEGETALCYIMLLLFIVCVIRDITINTPERELEE